MRYARPHGEYARLIFLPVLLILVCISQTVSAQEADIRQAVVRIDTIVPGDARTANVLGRERTGSGIVIDSSGLILTIGYLMMEAREATATFPDGRVLPAKVIAYDHESGFGLLRTLNAPNVDPIRIGDSDRLTDGDVALVLHAGDAGTDVGATPVRIVSRRSFAGYWEYLLDDAIFSSPPVRMFGGAAMVDEQGQLLAIGSLIVQDAAGPGRPVAGNMFVPVNELKPVLADLLEAGRRQQASHPWIGVITEEYKGHVLVLRASTEGPAARSGVASGDLIMAVGDSPVAGMEDFLRKVRALGPAGQTVPLSVIRPGEGMQRINIQSQDRNDWLRLKPGN